MTKNVFFPVSYVERSTHFHLMELIDNEYQESISRRSTYYDEYLSSRFVKNAVIYCSWATKGVLKDVYAAATAKMFKL